MSRVKQPHAKEPVLNGETFRGTWSKYFEQVWRKVGGGAVYSLGGRLTTNTTAVGNVGSGADDLITYTLEKNTLSILGDVLEITAFGTGAANANNKTIKLLLGTTELFSTGAVGSNNKDWEINCKIIRTAAATQECISQFNGDTVLVTQTADYISGTEDFTTDLTIKCTGEATSNDDIIQKGLIVKLFPIR